MAASPRLTAPELHFEHVLVPLDGSELALAALPTARTLAERFGADVRTMSVATNSDGAVRLFDEISPTLDDDAASGHLVVVSRGGAGDEIARHGDELGSCLVCLSTHARGRVSGALLGSVAESVLQRSGEPIIALGPSADRPGWSPTPLRWPAPLSVARMIACIDGSKASEAVLPVAAQWARSLGMSMTVLTVVDDAPTETRSSRQTNRYGPTRDAAQYVNEQVERLQDDALDVDGLVLRDPIGPASAVRAHLAERPAGLVAVGTRARPGLQRLVGGAAAASIVRASVAPCLVVPT